MINRWSYDHNQDKFTHGKESNKIDDIEIVDLKQRVSLLKEKPKNILFQPFS